MVVVLDYLHDRICSYRRYLCLGESRGWGGGINYRRWPRYKTTRESQGKQHVPVSLRQLLPAWMWLLPYQLLQSSLLTPPSLVFQCGLNTSIFPGKFWAFGAGLELPRHPASWASMVVMEKGYFQNKFWDLTTGTSTLNITWHNHIGVEP